MVDYPKFSLVLSTCSFVPNFGLGLGLGLVNNFVFQTGVFDLVSCLSQCRGDPLCQSVNYETGLCVTFSSSAPGEQCESILMRGELTIIL